MHACVLSHFSRVWHLAAPWTQAHQVPLSMGFSRQEYWSGLLCPLPGDLFNPGIKPMSLMSPALAGMCLTNSAMWEAIYIYIHIYIIQYLVKPKVLLSITKLLSNVGFILGWPRSPKMAGVCTIGVGRGWHACGHQLTQPNTLASLTWFLRKQGQSAAVGSPSFLPVSLLPCLSSDSAAPTATRLKGPSLLGYGDLGLFHFTELGTDALL